MNYEVNRLEQGFKEAIAYSIRHGSDKYRLVDKLPIQYYRETKMTDTQQQEKYALLNRVFTPASPILEKNLFAGRQEQVAKILRAITTPSQHAILYGERGIGKTSLANVIPSYLGEITGQNAIVTKVICTRDEDFKSLWKSTFDQILLPRNQSQERIGYNREPENKIVSQKLSDFMQWGEEITAKKIGEILGNFREQSMLFIFDEFDTIQNTATKRRFAEVIKTVSDQSSRCTVLLVGIGETITDLIGEHQSIERCIMQISLQKMEDKELKEIIENGLSKLEISIENTIKEEIVKLSQGLAYYTHLLCRYILEDMIFQKKDLIGKDELTNGILRCVDNAHESIKNSYQLAVTSNKSTMFKDVLQACVLIKEDEYGTFKASDLQEPLSRIRGEDIRTEQYQHHIGKLCKQEKGSILKRVGTKGNHRYKFRNPLFKTYVQLKVIAEKR
ncbi:ATP-binding protein [Microcoleus asticus]|uniref:Holliday junction ATP-dependent DNA helicase RuvB n=1 Tax=Microcoleus asticus IPMA8 TaxID=2563858 RepID=A0ABX2CXS3_9CYAN|nr:ATP-binding protein [Microcoleus asticus]NQE35184.1 Holliday junction ATP-dependent DNA helicase RuvB [Microcoleus asticus IPMA8]